MLGPETGPTTAASSNGSEWQLITRIAIGVALGTLLERHKISQADAWDRLVVQSQRKVYDLALELGSAASSLRSERPAPPLAPDDATEDPASGHT
jgi:hypothetical protein